MAMNEWFYDKKLSLNVEKSCYNVFGRQDDNTHHIKLGNINLAKVLCPKHIGVLIDSALSWKDHLKYMYNKLLKHVGIFYNLRKKRRNILLSYYIHNCCMVLTFAPILIQII